MYQAAVYQADRETGRDRLFTISALRFALQCTLFMLLI